MPRNRTFLIFCVMGMVLSCHAMDLYVAPDGQNNQAENLDTTFVTVQGALDRAALVIKKHGYPAQGIRIHIQPGQYVFNESLTWPSLCQGTSAHPFTLVGDAQQKPVFQGGLPIDLTQAELVQERSVLQRLHARAKGQVYRVHVKDATQAKLLRDMRVRLSYQGQTMQVARYPNVGYGHIEQILDKGAIYAHGRTPGDPPAYTMEKPIGGSFNISNKSIDAWEREFQRYQKAHVVGYLSYDWYKENHRIARIEAGDIQLLEYSRYGILSREKIPRRVIVKNLLCELDEPGEFFFDETNATLYFWPYGDNLNSEGLTLWAAQPFVSLKNVNNVSFQNIIIEGVSQGQAAVIIEDCNSVSMAGCKIRNCARPAVIIEGGEQCGLRSCDLYDVPHHLTLNGGDSKLLVPSGHYAENCHFTQVQATDYYGRIQVRGVGQIFRNNLVHNFIGQVMTVGGNDHLIEYNEFFNIGIEEGDGGTIYSGAQMWSWGNVYRHNFLHHLMCIPQAHPRGGIYPDDRDQGDTITENIFYKAAHRAVLLNGGAGHTVTSNLFLDCHIGVYNTDNGAEKMYRMQADYDSGKLKRGDKMDYIWRMEKAIGKEGWNSDIWKRRYPTFTRIMNQEKRRFWPIECVVTDNCFNGTEYNTQFLTFDAQRKRIEMPFEEASVIQAMNNRDIDKYVFTAPERLDYSYKPQYRNGQFPNVKFDNIGLYNDAYRTDSPEKSVYRSKVREHFKDRKSYDKDAKYNPTTINDSLYFNTGDLIINQ